MKTKVAKHTNQQVILILGAGVAGLHCALRLAGQVGQRKDLRIILVDRQNCHALHSTLYHAVSADMKRERFCLPIDEIIDSYKIEFLQDSVTEIDPIKQSAQLVKAGQLRYDYLVLALGSVPNDYHIPGITEYATFFGTFNNAIQLRKKILALINRHKRPKVVIGGGGLAGVELAGSLASRSVRGQINLTLIERSKRLLPTMPAKIIPKITRLLKSQKVGVTTGVGIKRLTTKAITLDSGEKIAYDLFIWTGGVRPNPVVAKAGLSYDPSGRVKVRPTLQARGYSRIYAVGDIAAFSFNGSVLPQSAPYAFRQGLHVSKNIIRQLYHCPPVPYHPDNYPAIISIGHLGGAFIWGSLALFGKWAYYLHRYLEWWYVSGLLPSPVARLRLFKQTPRLRPKSSN